MLNTNMLLTAAADGAEAVEAVEGVGMMGSLITFGPIILMFVLLYFIAIRPQRKREKETQNMRSKIEVGDEVITAGGIVGRVVSIRDETLVLETGSDRSKIRIMRWAIQKNNTVHDDTPMD